MVIRLKLKSPDLFLRTYKTTIQRRNALGVALLTLVCICFNLFIFGCSGSLLLLRLSLVVAGGGYSLSWRQGFSSQWLLLWSTWALGHAGVSSRGTWAQLLRSMWDLPGPEIRPVSPSLAGRFLTTGPPGKSLYFSVFKNFLGFSSVLMSTLIL